MDRCDAVARSVGQNRRKRVRGRRNSIALCVFCGQYLTIPIDRRSSGHKRITMKTAKHNHPLEGIDEDTAKSKSVRFSTTTNEKFSTGVDTSLPALVS